ncbi:MAG: hypothetical protein EF807_00135 [Candidatus Methanolliviera hydrocarbonicum]|uniref:Uncharacterized protein n=1 Tax=Candidatus Methanolliviera hydrocarbonicum TaxID=2491085 RepID=A0A520KZC3_9EURY|nr:MAG: hypothetical protein EF807_00135 [Candidatus Methanolliviera hydrocarbonicum]
MKPTRWIGVGIFLVGMIVLCSYSVYPIYNPDVEDATMLLGVRIGTTLLIIGAVILIVEISVERYREYKKMKEEITEEDLRP